MLQACLEDPKFEQKREQWSAQIEQRADELGTAGDHAEAMKLYHVIGHFLKLRDKREDEGVNFTPTGRSGGGGRPALTREQYDNAMKQARREKGTHE